MWLALPGWGIGQEPARPGALENFIEAGASWQLEPEQFALEYGQFGFRWLSDARQRARATGDRLLLWDGAIQATEAVVDFRDGRLSGVALSIFNRGDQGVASLPDRESFEQRVRDLIAVIGDRLAAPGESRARGDAEGAVRADGWIWLTDTASVLLEWSYQREVRTRNVPYSPEFIRLRLAPPPRERSLLEEQLEQQQMVRREDLPANLVKSGNGDVLIGNVPMVDQGDKGYCAVATAERVFLYYGMPVDQHEMAQIAESSSAGGTSPDKMLDALRALQGRLTVRVRSLQEWDVRDFQRLITNYNREARRRGLPQIETGRIIDVAYVYSRMDTDTLRETRARGADRERFLRQVRDYIDRGVPVIWSVQLGLVPERAIPQAAGGHMRLIIGYNDSTSELIFSDSWGAGHERKRMAMADAHTITTGLYIIEPRR